MVLNRNIFATIRWELEILRSGKLAERWFTVDSGVKQGRVLFALLFLLVLDWFMRILVAKVFSVRPLNAFRRRPER